ncbi:ABC transporter permease [Marinivivus vitaminiproducens]|uniref:ABC transporter permease n=1 Tax=Marinivivus vitaminiproducens TaxID=3035935 RepID=UPI0027A88F1B|nr:ABC transporter permease [Geminicoccaceae bacterium SCSIO 64248]
MASVSGRPEEAGSHSTAPTGAKTFDTPGDYNLIGLWTLYQKEVRRFAKIPAQTVFAPIITTLIFLVVFSLALGGAGRTTAGMPFLEFVAPGLIMMAVVQNAFANTSSSLIIAKVQGTIVDLLMPPLGPGELVLGIVAGGVTRGIVVGVAVGLGMLPFVPMALPHPLAALAYLLLAATLLALLGTLGGLWAEKFDQTSMLTNFVVTPLSFLSGTFYAVDQLPEPFHLIALANPFFYMIDGLRFAFTGQAEGSIAFGFLFLLALNIACGWLAHRIVSSGYRLKS